MSKGLKLRVRKVLGVIPTFVEVTGEQLLGGGGGGGGGRGPFCTPPPEKC